MKAVIVFMLGLILIAAFFDLTRKEQPAAAPTARPKKKAKPRQPQNGQNEIEKALRQMIAKELRQQQRTG